MTKYILVFIATLLWRRDKILCAISFSVISSYLLQTNLFYKLSLTEYILISNTVDIILLVFILYFCEVVTQKLSILTCILIKLIGVVIWQYPFYLGSTFGYYFTSYSEMAILEILFLVVASKLDTQNFYDYMYLSSIAVIYILF